MAAAAHQIVFCPQLKASQVLVPLAAQTGQQLRSAAAEQDADAAVRRVAEQQLQHWRNVLALLQWSRRTGCTTERVNAAAAAFRGPQLQVEQAIATLRQISANVAALPKPPPPVCVRAAEAAAQGMDSGEAGAKRRRVEEREAATLVQAETFSRLAASPPPPGVQVARAPPPGVTLRRPGLWSATLAAAAEHGAWKVLDARLTVPGAQLPRRTQRQLLRAASAAFAEGLAAGDALLSAAAGDVVQPLLDEEAKQAAADWPWLRSAGADAGSDAGDAAASLIFDWGPAGRRGVLARPSDAGVEFAQLHSTAGGALQEAAAVVVPPEPLGFSQRAHCTVAAAQHERLAGLAVQLRAQLTPAPECETLTGFSPLLRVTVRRGCMACSCTVSVDPADGAYLVSRGAGDAVREGDQGVVAAVSTQLQAAAYAQTHAALAACAAVATANGRTPELEGDGEQELALHLPTGGLLVVNAAEPSARLEPLKGEPSELAAAIFGAASPSIRHSVALAAAEAVGAVWSHLQSARCTTSAEGAVGDGQLLLSAGTDMLCAAWVQDCSSPVGALPQLCGALACEGQGGAVTAWADLVRPPQQQQFAAATVRLSAVLALRQALQLLCAGSPAAAARAEGLPEIVLVAVGPLLRLLQGLLPSGRAGAGAVAQLALWQWLRRRRHEADALLRAARLPALAPPAAGCPLSLAISITKLPLVMTVAARCDLPECSTEGSEGTVVSCTVEPSSDPAASDSAQFRVAAALCAAAQPALRAAVLARDTDAISSRVAAVKRWCDTAARSPQLAALPDGATVVVHGAAVWAAEICADPLAGGALRLGARGGGEVLLRLPPRRR
eukprot:TRINITY_DN29726_c0_g2_i1.p1 TRINITY_DN29726_c0_g2~~TRINITY_DN29726_c0_g2_i1.p1  ORF type:complete len:840 (+),score=209.77 TRINITY_DN29726_c0_g2_i1:89-2608(+)